MEPDKLDRFIRRKLQGREIKPSPQTWDKITAGLEIEAKTKRSGHWYRIAAAVVFLVCASYALSLLNDGIGVIKNPLVDNPREVAPKPVAGEDSFPFSKHSKKSTITRVEDEVKKSTLVSDQKVVMENDVALGKVNPKKTMSIKTTAIKPTVVEAQLPEEILDTKIAEVLAEVDFLEQSSTVTNAEIDSLLKKAQQEILQHRAYQINGAIDAVALLTEVEEELDQSFRDQILESLKQRFLKVRTAVADRNN